MVVLEQYNAADDPFRRKEIKAMLLAQNHFTQCFLDEDDDVIADEDILRLSIDDEDDFFLGAGAW